MKYLDANGKAQITIPTNLTPGRYTLTARPYNKNNSAANNNLTYNFTIGDLNPTATTPDSDRQELEGRTTTASGPWNLAVNTPGATTANPTASNSATATYVTGPQDITYTFTTPTNTTGTYTPQIAFTPTNTCPTTLTFDIDHQPVTDTLTNTPVTFTPPCPSQPNNNIQLDTNTPLTPGQTHTLTLHTGSDTINLDYLRLVYKNS